MARIGKSFDNLFDEINRFYKDFQISELGLKKMSKTLKDVNRSSEVINGVFKEMKTFAAKFGTDKMRERGRKGYAAGIGKARADAPGFESIGEKTFNTGMDALFKKLKLPDYKRFLNFLIGKGEKGEKGYQPGIADIKNMTNAYSYLNGIIKQGKGLITFITEGLKGLFLVLKALLTKTAAAVGIGLGPLTLIIIALAAAALFAKKTLDAMWKTNSGGIQSSVNIIRGKWQAGMARVDVAFNRLGRAMDPLIRPLVQLGEKIIGNIIDRSLWLIEAFIDVITVITSLGTIIRGFMNVIVGSILGGFGEILTGILNLLKPLFILLGHGTIFDTLEFGADRLSNLKAIGESEISSGWGSIAEIIDRRFNESKGNTSNNISFHVGGSGMTQDSYMLFANRILDSIA